MVTYDSNGIFKLSRFAKIVRNHFKGILIIIKMILSFIKGFGIIQSIFLFFSLKS